MIEFIGTVIGGIIIIIGQCIWWIFETFYPVIIMGSIIGIPLCLLFKRRWDTRVNKLKYRLTPQKASIYYNSFGHLVKVEPKEGMEQSVREHFRDTNVTERTFRRS